MEIRKHPIYLMCSQMSGSCYIDAQYIAEKERDASKSNNIPMSSLMSAFVKICSIEKQYFSLSFLVSRRFLMKDTALQSGYAAILNHDLKKTEEWRSCQISRSLSRELIEFVKGRLELLAFYESVAKYGDAVTVAEKELNEAQSRNLDTVLMPIDDLMIKIQNIIKLFKNCMSNELLKPLNDLFTWELDALLGLFSCFHHLNHFRYLESLMEIDRTKRALNSWVHALQTHTESRSSKFFASSWFGGSPQPKVVSPSTTSEEPKCSEEGSDGLTYNYIEPQLVTWLNKIRNLGLSKLSLYFFDVLVKQSNFETVIETCSKLSNDIPSKLINAQKRFDLSYIVITFDASNEVGYKGPGFHYPEIKKETPRGRLNLFPCAFACPDAPKADFWATIIMTIDDNDQNLNKLNKIIHTYDNRGDIGYTLVRVEPKLTMVAISQGKPEKDTSLTGFMIDIAAQLRGGKFFARNSMTKI